MPFKKVPVLHAEINNQPIIITQSTTILRSLSETLNNVDEKWFPKTFNERYRINEFIDFFHFSMNAVSHCNDLRILYGHGFGYTVLNWSGSIISVKLISRNFS